MYLFGLFTIRVTIFRGQLRRDFAVWIYHEPELPVASRASAAIWRRDDAEDATLTRGQHLGTMSGGRLDDRISMGESP